MKALFCALLLALALAGCAAQPSTVAKRDPEAGSPESANPRARIHTELAAQYFVRRQFAVSLQELREAVAADAAYAPAYNMLGLVHAELLEEREAEANFRRSLDLAPDYSEAHNNYGHFLCTHARRAEAMAQFEKAWQNPLYARPEQALANAALCMLRSGDLAEAERLAQRALVRAESQPQALAVMAELHFRRGDLVAARSLLRQLESQSGLDAASLWLAVKIERATGRREVEATYGLQLRRNFPESPEATWLLSGRYDMPGDQP